MQLRVLPEFLLGVDQADIGQVVSQAVVEHFHQHLLALLLLLLPCILTLGFCLPIFPELLIHPLNLLSVESHDLVMLLAERLETPRFYQGLALRKLLLLAVGPLLGFAKALLQTLVAVAEFAYVVVLGV